jgi:hypothetical protein
MCIVQSPFGLRCSLRRASDVVRLSPRQIILKRFSEKDQENFPETCVSPTKTQGKKIERIFIRSRFFRRSGSNPGGLEPIEARVGRFLPTQ